MKIKFQFFKTAGKSGIFGGKSAGKIGEKIEEKKTWFYKPCMKFTMFYAVLGSGLAFLIGGDAFAYYTGTVTAPNCSTFGAKQGICSAPNSADGMATTTSGSNVICNGSNGFVALYPTSGISGCQSYVSSSTPAGCWLLCANCTNGFGRTNDTSPCNSTGCPNSSPSTFNATMPNVNGGEMACCTSSSSACTSTSWADVAGQNYQSYSQASWTCGGGCTHTTQYQCKSGYTPTGTFSSPPTCTPACTCSCSNNSVVCMRGGTCSCSGSTPNYATCTASSGSCGNPTSPATCSCVSGTCTGVCPNGSISDTNGWYTYSGSAQPCT